MNLYLDNYLIIENPTKEALQYCEEKLTFANPDFINRERLGKYTGSMPRVICLYQKYGNKLILPFGVYKDFYFSFWKSIDICVCQIHRKQTRNYQSSITLFDYQEKAVECVVSEKNGVLVAPCGSGKTQMGLEIASKIGGRTLWITHTIDLLRQSMSRAMANFGMPKSEYGSITDGKVNIGNTITFATVQTLSSVDLNLLKDSFDCIIVDECHHCVGSPTKMKMFYKVMSGLSARYKIGLTATPFRSDGLHEEMFSIIGNKIYEVPKSAVKEKTCKVVVKFFNSGYTPNEEVVFAGDGTIVYSRLIDDIIKDDLRNHLIAGVVHMSKGATLVLSDRIEHLRILQDKLKGCKKTAFISASNTKKEKDERKIAIEKLNSGEINVLFATYQLAKEGLDIPNLMNVVFASPIKDKTTVIQSAGRVERKADGKEFGTVIDFYDEFGILKGYARQRSSYYKKMGYEIINND